MTTLKGRVILSFIEILPSVSRLEVCRNLFPYEDRYQFILSSEGIVFPETMCPEQRAIQRLYSPGIYQHEILYRDIVALKKTSGGVHLFLRTGHVFFFGQKNTLWKIVNVYNYGEPCTIQGWWWKLCGKFRYLQRLIIDHLSSGRL